MQRISAPGHVNGLFVNEDAANGVAPTMVDADWLNAVQEELVAVATAKGAALDKADKQQVLKAIQALLGAKVDEHEAKADPHNQYLLKPKSGSYPTSIA